MSLAATATFRVTDTPGPGSYDISNATLRSSPAVSMPRAARFKQLAGSSAVGFTMSPGPDYSPNHDATSVKRKSNGVSFPRERRFRNGSLRMQSPGFVYDPNHDAISTARGSARHSFPKSARAVLSVPTLGTLPTPGPNAYDVERSYRAIVRQTPLGTFGSAKRGALNRPRSTPGPEYDLMNSSTRPSRIRNPPSFSFTMAKKPEPSSAFMPDPGSYTPSTGEEISNRVKRLPISFPRASRDRSTSDPGTPGPQYNPNDGALSTRRRSPSISFTRQRQRDTGMDTSRLPAPNTYRPRISSVRRRSPSYSFGRSKAHQQLSFSSSSSPGPIYSTVEAFNHVSPSTPKVSFTRQRRDSSARSRTTPAPNQYYPERSMVAVMPTSPRAVMPKDRRRTSEPRHTSPGPVYNLPQPKSPGISFTRQRRFIEDRSNSTPAPGQYDVNDSVVAPRVSGTVRF